MFFYGPRKDLQKNLEWCLPGRPRNSWMQEITGMRKRGELATWNGSTQKGGETNKFTLGTETCENINNLYINKIRRKGRSRKRRRIYNLKSIFNFYFYFCINNYIYLYIYLFNTLQSINIRSLLITFHVVLRSAGGLSSAVCFLIHVEFCFITSTC